MNPTQACHVRDPAQNLSGHSDQFGGAEGSNGTEVSERPKLNYKEQVPLCGVYTMPINNIRVL